MTQPNTYRYCTSKRIKFGEQVWSCLMWAYFELLRLHTNVWVESINIGTLVVKGLMYIFVDESLASTKTCADTKFRM